jgi:hypothetical protein
LFVHICLTTCNEIIFFFVLIDLCIFPLFDIDRFEYNRVVCQLRPQLPWSSQFFRPSPKSTYIRPDGIRYDVQLSISRSLGRILSDQVSDIINIWI